MHTSAAAWVLTLALIAGLLALDWLLLGLIKARRAQSIHADAERLRQHHDASTTPRYRAPCHHGESLA